MQIFYHRLPDILHWDRECASQNHSIQDLRRTDSPTPRLQQLQQTNKCNNKKAMKFIEQTNAQIKYLQNTSAEDMEMVKSSAAMIEKSILVSLEDL